MTRVYQKRDVITDIEDLVYRCTQKDVAKKIGISESYLSDVLKGRRDPGKKILDFLGYEKIVCYKEIMRKV